MNSTLSNTPVQSPIFGGKTGEECHCTGIYECNLNPFIEISLEKGDIFPEGIQGTDEKANWLLTRELPG